MDACIACGGVEVSINVFGFDESFDKAFRLYCEIVAL